MSDEQFEANSELVRLYFEENLTFFQNEAPLQPTWIGYETNDTNLSAYIEFENVPTTEEIKLQSTIMIERHRKQQNMVHWKFGEGYKTFVLNRKNIDVELTP